MAPHDVISRVDLGSFIEAYGGESRQTIFDLISEITDSMKRMSGAMCVVSCIYVSSLHYVNLTRPACL